jgi:hypothetical protein
MSQDVSKVAPLPVFSKLFSLPEQQRGSCLSLMFNPLSQTLLPKRKNENKFFNNYSQLLENNLSDPSVLCGVAVWMQFSWYHLQFGRPTHLGLQTKP